MEWDIVSMCEFDGDLYVATTRNVYIKEGDEFRVVRFRPLKEEEK